MVALILADGDAPTRSRLDEVWPGWDDAVDLVIAADGGARHAETLGVSIDRWVGDGDSIGDDDLAALAARGIPIERSRPDKDESDTELAIRAALGQDSTGVVIVGALGGPRFDHSLANIGLLAMPDLAGRTATIVDGSSRIRLIQAPGPDGQAVHCQLDGRPGDHISLLPMGGPADGVTTSGLVYPLATESLLPGTARGLSNVRAGPEASVTVGRGQLLVIESPDSL